MLIKTGKEIRSSGQFRKSERIAIIKEYLATNESKTSLWRKHSGQQQEHGAIHRWMRQLGYIGKNKTMQPKKKKAQPSIQFEVQEDTTSLKKQLKKLKSALDNALLRAESSELVIEIAEKELKIPIRKKFVTK